MKSAHVLFLLVCLTAFTPGYSFAIPAFPGAVGVGANSAGGRGGTVIHVTNLNDSGIGSLREALATPGARTIVFDVSGNIDLTSILTVTEPYLTIAGQTSPGGISVSGKQFNIATHDVIIRHMRFRSGGHRYTGNDSDGDSFSLWGANWNGGKPVYNIMIDHCSFTWGVDETMSVTGGAENVTIQNSLVAGGLWYAKLGYPSNHSKGLMVSGKNNYDTEVSLYKNYIAHNYDRSPLISNPHADNTVMLVDYVNNVSYNWHSGLRPAGGGDAHINWIANYMKEGPDSGRQDYFMQQEYAPASPEELFYVLDNIGTGRSNEDPQWRVSVDWHDTLLSDVYQHHNRWAMETLLSYETMTEAFASEIVANSGATIPIRDSVDTAYVNSFDAGTDLMEKNPAGDKVYPDDWPTYSTAKDNPIDTDSDGMPDAWEIANNLNETVANNNAHNLDTNYTDLEVYINNLAGQSATIILLPPNLHPIVTN